MAMTNTPDKSEMKACPFCGCEKMKYGCPQRAPYHSQEPEHYNVHCECGAAGPDAPTADEAIRLFSTRPADQVPDMVEWDVYGETVLGMRVAAYRETHPEHGNKFGHIYSEHWSTPNWRHPNVKVERLFTEKQVLDLIQQQLATIERLSAALENCRNKFLHYEDLHRRKCTAEGDEKAGRNREMADMCSTALGKDASDG